MKIAIVEDEPKLAAVLDKYLKAEGFETVIYSDGSVALAAMLDSMPDFILLDVMLPGIDGFSVCRQIRDVSSVPIVLLTARVEEGDRLLGLETGADDYVCKPYSPREVVARIKAILRRTTNLDDAATVGLHSNTFSFDERTAKVRFLTSEVSLTFIELQLLKVMHRHPGQIFSRSQLMQKMYADGRIVSDRTIDSHVKKLRQKLSSLSGCHTFIQSVYGFGYKFEWSEDSD